MNSVLLVRHKARHRFAASVYGVLLTVVSQASVAAALDDSDLAGTVYSEQGEPLAGVEIRVIDAAGHVVATARTDSHGDYEIDTLAAGHYLVRSQLGDRQIGEAEIDALPGSSLQLPFGTATQEIAEVSVTAQRLEQARNALSPSTGSSQYVFDDKAIDALPQGDNTPLNDVLLQAPGVVNDSDGQLHIRGDHGDLQYRINGVILPEGVSSFGQTLDTHFAQKIDLLTGALPAQYGYRTAGVVDIVTKQHLDGGALDLYGGSHNSYSPSVEFGHTLGRFSSFVSASYQSSELGLAPPTAGASPMHDTTKQGKGFAYLSYLFGDGLKLSGMFGLAASRFEIPNNPGQPPLQDYLAAAGLTNFDSSTLNSRQFENTQYGLLALQGSAGQNIDYQIAVFDRSSSVKYEPDSLGELVFNGDASTIKRKSSTYGVQGDLKLPLSDTHTLRSGLLASTEDDRADNTSLVFPQDPTNAQCTTSGPPPGDSGYCITGGPITIVDNNPKNGNALFGVYVQDQWDLSDALTLNYGLRYDRVNAYIDSQQVSPRLGVIWYPSQGTTVHAGYARYFTPPPNELVSDNSLEKFVGTTNQQSLTNSPVKPERDHYLDIGVSQQFTPSLNVGLDTFYKYAKDLLDEGQFGSALILTPFNYSRAHVYGFELSSAYHHEGLSAYANLAHTIAQATDVNSGQFNFDSTALTYISQHYIYLDHDQHWSASGGVSYQWAGTTFGSNFTYGGGLRNDGNGSVPNGGKQPSNMQVDLSAMRPLQLGSFGEVDLRAVVLNVLDRTNQIHDGTGIGVGAAQYGPRRAFYFGVSKPF